MPIPERNASRETALNATRAGRRQGTPASAEQRFQLEAAFTDIAAIADFRILVGCLQHDTVVNYKVTDYYSFDHDCGLLWNDPALAIDWPVNDAAAVLSDKDRNQPLLSDLRAIWHMRDEA